MGAAEVKLVSADLGGATVARMAVEQGAEVLGAAGGDGTVSAVAAVAAESDRPLVVVSAGKGTSDHRERCAPRHATRLAVRLEYDESHIGSFAIQPWR